MNEFNQDQAFTKCLQAWKAKDFETAGRIFTVITENIPLNELEELFTRDPGTATGMLKFYSDTGLSETPEGTPIKDLHQRLIRYLIQDISIFSGLTPEQVWTEMQMLGKDVFLN